MTSRSLAYTVSGVSCIRALAALALLVVPAACDGPSDPGPDPDAPALVEIVSGEDQTGPVSTLLPEPLVVRVENARGQPVRDIEVQWIVALGGGSLNAIASRTNEAGLASIRWTLGPTVGRQVVQGGVVNVDNAHLTFEATATPAP